MKCTNYTNYSPLIRQYVVACNNYLDDDPLYILYACISFHNRNDKFLLAKKIIQIKSADCRKFIIFLENEHANTGISHLFNRFCFYNLPLI